MKIFDTHCHYNLEPLYSGQVGSFSVEQISNTQRTNWQQYWQQAQNSNVTAALIPGTNLKSSQKAVKIAATDIKLFASVGLHPSDGIESTDEGVESDFKQIKNLAANKDVGAIGETGLDYFHLSPTNRTSHINKQKKLFIQHIKLANDLQKPLIIHSRDKKEQAYWDILSLLRKYYKFHKPCVLHCFSGPKKYLKQISKMNVYFSVAGNITYHSADKLRKMLIQLPIDRLLLETDAPFLPPQAYRGQINQPRMIKNTAIFLQTKLNINLDQIFDNSLQFLGISFKQN